MDMRAFMEAIAAAIDPLTKRVRLLVGKGTLHLVNDAPQVQTVQATFLAGETRDDVERSQDYGFTSVPLPGMQPIAVFVGGDRSNGIVLAVADRTYRLRGLAGGEVAIYDDLGQKVHLTRAGIVVGGAGLPVIVTDTPKVTLDTPLVHCTGDLLVDGNADAKGEITDRIETGGRSMSGMRATFDTHVHPENDEGGPTDPPSEAM
ncbi:MAG: phage baseplate assembly protein V [Rhodospirillaceae bacterium]